MFGCFYKEESMKNIIIDAKIFAQILNNCDDQELRDYGGGLIDKAENPMIPLDELAAKLERPVAIFDVETTGTNPQVDRVVSLDVSKIWPNGEVEKTSWLVNPTIPIPEGASKIHKITDEKVAEQPTFCESSHYILEQLSDCDLITFNGNKFDIPLLMEEFNRCGVAWPDPDQLRIDVSQMYRAKNKRSLQDAHVQYIGSEFEGAHDSGNDVQATLNVLLAMLKDEDDYDLHRLHLISMENPNQVDMAGKIYKDGNGEFRFSFGKHKDKRVLDEVSYAAWMRDSDFPSETKRWLEKILEKGQAFALGNFDEVPW